MLTTDACAEIVIWQVPKRLSSSEQNFKYRLAYVVANECVIRYNNEPAKGDHRHTDAIEALYNFSTANQLMTDFAADIVRWNHENGRA